MAAHSPTYLAYYIGPLLSKIEESCVTWTHKCPFSRLLRKNSINIDIFVVSMWKLYIDTFDILHRYFRYFVSILSIFCIDTFNILYQYFRYFFIDIIDISELVRVSVLTRLSDIRIVSAEYFSFLTDMRYNYFRLSVHSTHGYTEIRMILRTECQHPLQILSEYNTD